MCHRWCSGLLRCNNTVLLPHFSTAASQWLPVPQGLVIAPTPPPNPGRCRVRTSLLHLPQQHPRQQGTMIPTGEPVLRGHRRRWQMRHLRRRRGPAPARSAICAHKILPIGAAAGVTPQHPSNGLPHHCHRGNASCRCASRACQIRMTGASEAGTVQQQQRGGSRGGSESVARASKGGIGDSSDGMFGVTTCIGSSDAQGGIIVSRDADSREKGVDTGW